MIVKTTNLEGLLVINPGLYKDVRGSFHESYNKHQYSSIGLDQSFVQDNLSHSRKGVIRGLHFQQERPQAKLVTVAQGLIMDIAVDLRPGSDTFGYWQTFYLGNDSYTQVFIPKGFAHGFEVLSDEATVLYKVDDYRNPGDEYTLRYDDKDLGIKWHTDTPILSDKDKQGMTLKEYVKLWSR
jgi:dTDP-4-dehydrorhamnose 3,5-epimerase